MGLIAQDRSRIPSIKPALCSLVQRNPGIVKQNPTIYTYCSTNFYLRQNTKVQALLVSMKWLLSVDFQKTDEILCCVSKQI